MAVTILGMAKNNDTGLISSILNEAEVDFQTNRFENAAKSFDFLRNKTMENRDYLDAMYFTYRSLHSWERYGDPLNFCKLYQRQAIDSLRISTKLALKNLEDVVEIKEKLVLLKIIEGNLRMFDEDRQRVSVIEKIIDLSYKRVQDGNLERKVKEKYCETIIRYGVEINNPKAIKFGKTNCAEIKIQRANEILISDGYDANIVASYLFYEAGLLYDSIPDKKKGKKFKEQALGHFPELDVSKFVEIQFT